ncbi:uncharacterized protein LOC111619420 [Centruroides sculpturatus]|uniref:uncharacterized protein LOC111619420 n=1 Tax=Centruroides sculpturatus TaxID=218467 RepID=UPI000C6CD511|nr:uncharacterized protein LOC111619420 [Centruroides sculpturatus]
MKSEKLATELSSWFPLDSSISGPILATLHFIQDFLISSCYLVTPSLIVYCCIFLSMCFKNLSDRLKYIRQSNLNESLRNLDKVKIRYFKLFNIAELLNKCFSVELFRIFTSNGLVCCISAYYIVTINQNLDTRISYIMKFIFMFLLMLLPALATTSMANKAFSLFDELNQFSFQLPREERQSVISLMLICQNQRPTLTGWSFFDINLDLIVSITATIITYTVILVQSN